jgi:hypothetical protein
MPWAGGYHDGDVIAWVSRVLTQHCLNDRVRRRAGCTSVGLSGAAALGACQLARLANASSAARHNRPSPDGTYRLRVCEPGPSVASGVDRSVTTVPIGLKMVHLSLTLVTGGRPGRALLAANYHHHNTFRKFSTTVVCLMPQSKRLVPLACPLSQHLALSALLIRQQLLPACSAMKKSLSR